MYQHASKSCRNGRCGSKGARSFYRMCCDRCRRCKDHRKGALGFCQSGGLVSPCFGWPPRYFANSADYDRRFNARDTNDGTIIAPQRCEAGYALIARPLHASAEMIVTAERRQRDSQCGRIVALAHIAIERRSCKAIHRRPNIRRGARATKPHAHFSSLKHSPNTDRDPRRPA
jgi:hypothetical protein